MLTTTAASESLVRGKNLHSVILRLPMSCSIDFAVPYARLKGSAHHLATTSWDLFC